MPAEMIEVSLAAALGQEQPALNEAASTTPLVSSLCVASTV
jgi:hypothetical protein